MKKKFKLDKEKILIVVAALVIAILVFLLITQKNYKYTRSTKFVDGISAKETLVIKTSYGKVKKLKVTKVFTLSDFYDQYGTYYDAIKSINEKCYEYLGEKVESSQEGKTLTITVETDHDGLVLDNLSIKQNGDEKTSIRYDGKNDLTDESTIKIGDKLDKKLLKKLGYE